MNPKHDIRRLVEKVRNVPYCWVCNDVPDQLMPTLVGPMDLNPDARKIVRTTAETLYNMTRI